MRMVFQDTKENVPDSSETLFGNAVDHATKLKILARANRRRLPSLIDCDDPEMIACANLIDSGELDGCVILGADGKPQKVSRAYITASGQEFLEQFETETLSPFALAQTHRLIRGFGFAAIFICLLVAFPKTNKSGERANRLRNTSGERVDSLSKPNKSDQRRPDINLELENSVKVDTVTEVRIDTLKFVNGLCLRGSQLD